MGLNRRRTSADTSVAPTVPIACSDPAPAPLELVINGRFLCQPATGVQRVSREFVGALDRLLQEGAYPHLTATLVVPRGADVAALELQRIRAERIGGGKGYYWEQVALARRARGRWLVCLGNTAPTLSLLTGQHVAVMLHDQSYKLFPDDYSITYRMAHAMLDRMIFAHARPLLTVSETEKTMIRRHHPGAIVVTPNGSWIADRPVDGRAAAAPGAPVYGMYVGGFSERKNTGALFRVATALALGRGAGFRFVGTRNAACDAFVDALPDEARGLIEFTGRVSNETLEDLYRGASYLLYPSFYEASGLPPSEAMTFGCPVIVSDLPVMRERCGDAALYCDPHDDASIVASVERLLHDPGLAGELSARGLDRARRFTWRSQAIQIIAAIEAARAAEEGRAHHAAVEAA